MSKKQSGGSDSRVGVVGLGYVGLPLAVRAIGAGFEVIGYDVSEDRVASLSAGRSVVSDITDAELTQALATGRLTFSADPASLRPADAVMICVPTPLTPTKDPDLSYVRSAAEAVSHHLERGKLVILESTTYPGTTDEVVLPILESSGLKAGVDFHLAYSPERIDPGNAGHGVSNTPKVIGGFDKASADRASALYQSLSGSTVVVSSMRSAEMAKLLENIFRSVNIALVNELLLLSDRMGVDIWEVIDAAATKPFGFMPFYPGPGLGGHCIPIDPFYLSWKAREFEFHTEFIELAGKINSAMPRHVVQRVIEELNQQGKSVKGASCLILGMAYKKNVDDSRETPAAEVISLLAERGALVSYHDPFVESAFIGGITIDSVPLTAEALGECDCAVIITDHTDVDYGMVCEIAPLVFDTRNVTGRLGLSGPSVVRL